MIKRQKINPIFFIALYVMVLMCSCSQKRDDIENILSNNNFKYWRINYKGINGNHIIRFDKDGSAYTIAFNHDELTWDLLNNINQQNCNNGNIWIYKKDSIFVNDNYFAFALYNKLTDSMYAQINRTQRNTYIDKKGILKDSTIYISYILKPYKYQIDYFNFDSIKKLKGTNLYFNRDLRNKIKWQ